MLATNPGPYFSPPTPPPRRPSAVPDDHWLLGPTPDLSLHADGRRFWKRAGLTPARAAVVCTAHDGEIVAFLRFSHSPRPGGTATLHALGSWVHPEYRARGLAFSLWRYAIRRFRVRSVTVCTVSTGGRKLIGAVVAAHPALDFSIT